MKYLILLLLLISCKKDSPNPPADLSGHWISLHPPEYLDLQITPTEITDSGMDEESYVVTHFYPHEVSATCTLSIYPGQQIINVRTLSLSDDSNLVDCQMICDLNYNQLFTLVDTFKMKKLTQ